MTWRPAYLAVRPDDGAEYGRPGRRGKVRVMEQVRQGILKRLVAAVIDAVVLIVLCVGVSVALMFVPRIAAIVSALVALAYMATELVFAQTPGKMVLGLTVTSPDGTPATREALIKRYAVKNASGFLSLAAAITTVMALSYVGGLIGLVVFAAAFLMLRPDRLAGHDIVAGTAVYGSADPKLTFAVPSFPPKPVAVAV